MVMYEKASCECEVMNTIYTTLICIHTFIAETVKETFPVDCDILTEYGCLRFTCCSYNLFSGSNQISELKFSFQYNAYYVQFSMREICDISLVETMSCIIS